MLDLHMSYMCVSKSGLALFCLTYLPLIFINVRIQLEASKLKMKYIVVSGGESNGGQKWLCLQSSTPWRKAGQSPYLTLGVSRYQNKELTSLGVISGAGKGIVASSAGLLLQSKGFIVTTIKIDPYINIDSGTMSPLQ